MRRYKTGLKFIAIVAGVGGFIWSRGSDAWWVQLIPWALLVVLWIWAWTKRESAGDSKQRN